MLASSSKSYCVGHVGRRSFAHAAQYYRRRERKKTPFQQLNELVLQKKEPKRLLRDKVREHILGDPRTEMYIQFS